MICLSWFCQLYRSVWRDRGTCISTKEVTRIPRSVFAQYSVFSIDGSFSLSKEFPRFVKESMSGLSITTVFPRYNVMIKCYEYVHFALYCSFWIPSTSFHHSRTFPLHLLRKNGSRERSKKPGVLSNISTTQANRYKSVNFRTAYRSNFTSRISWRCAHWTRWSNYRVASFHWQLSWFLWSWKWLLPTFPDYFSPFPAFWKVSGND